MKSLALILAMVLAGFQPPKQTNPSPPSPTPQQVAEWNAKHLAQPRPVMAPNVPAAQPQRPAAAARKNEVDAPQPPDFELPDEIKGKRGQFIPIRPKTKGKWIVYYAIDEGLQVFPSEMLANKTQTVVSAAEDGRYRLLAYTAVGGVPSLPAVVTIVVGDSPTPPGPGPGPNPPPVVDPLQPLVNAAYASDSPPDPLMKRNAAQLYVTYYRNAAGIIGNYQGTSEDEMWLRVQAIENTSGINLTYLTGVRMIIRAEILRIRPKPPNDPSTPPLTADVKKQIADCFSRFASLLEGAMK